MDDTFRLLADDLINGSYWPDVRKVQDSSRNFGPGPAAAWDAFRKVMPLRSESDEASARPGEIAYQFLKANPASNFVPMQQSKIGGDSDKTTERPRRVLHGNVAQ